MESSERVELPAAFEDAPIDQLVQLIADMLERLMAHNDQIPLLPESLTRFHSRSAPSISVLDYLKRIVRFTNVEKSCLLITLHYIDQICARMPLFTLSSLTCHRFIIASITVSSKGLCDAFCTNSLYAKVGGISVTELNILEREFLAAIGWRLTVSSLYFYHSLHTLHRRCTRELLQEYYVNLVRTNSSGRFVIVGSQSPTSTLSDSDAEMDSGQSRPPSPSDAVLDIRHRHRPSGHETSTILIDPATITQDVTRRPTVEQNMAFAALRDSQGPTDKGDKG
ncbi:putative cyclin-domain-containing protein [Lyophyllum shimeji]|uniref:Cyclin-domain-containing protein n=1 Tax=Lyophyllum shimeji TaxID=47721 RepID=A0A9P3PKT0_LYOSH|nr:putative cyclin-domain-containing protein [Lyophyllum shimeji]